MAPGPVTTIATTVAALVGCGVPLAWYQLPAVSDIHQPAFASSQTEVVQDSFVLPEASERPKVELLESPPVVAEVVSSTPSLGHISTDDAGDAAPQTQPPAIGELVWSTLDAWSLGPLAREWLCSLLHEWGMTWIQVRLPWVPGIMFLALAADIALVPLVLCLKFCRCCRLRSPKTTPPRACDAKLESKASEEDCMSARIAKVSTPARAQKPTVSPPCVPIRQPPNEDAPDDFWPQENGLSLKDYLPQEQTEKTVEEQATARKTRGRGAVHYGVSQRIEEFSLNGGASEFVPGKPQHVQFQ